MKVMFLLFCAVVGVHGVGLQCHQGDDNAAAKESVDCSGDQAAATKCNGPTFVEYTGLSAGAYRCGDCDAASKTAGTCVECQTFGCNAPRTDTYTFECANHKYDVKSKAFVREHTLTECHALKHSRAVCNSHGAKAGREYVVQQNGCGPCDAWDRTDMRCVQCEGDRCNSDGSDNSGRAAAITAFLLPMIALFYSLF